MEKKRLQLKKENKKIAGVCSGIADYFDIDPTLVRLIWVLLFICFGFGLIMYVAAMLVMPKEDTPNESVEAKKLYRLKDDRKIAGVCSGFGEYFDIDPTFVRLAWLIATLCYGIGALAYLIAIIIIPNKPQN